MGGPVRKVANQPENGIFRTTQEVEVIEEGSPKKLTLKVNKGKPKSPTKPPKHVNDPKLTSHHPSKGKTNLTQPADTKLSKPQRGEVEPEQTKRNLTGDPDRAVITRKCAMLIMCLYERVGS